MPEDDTGLLWRWEIFMYMSSPLSFLLRNPTKSPPLMAEAKNV